jgi:hypothetical protein
MGNQNSILGKFGLKNFELNFNVNYWVNIAICGDLSM